MSKAPLFKIVIRLLKYLIVFLSLIVFLLLGLMVVATKMYNDQLKEIALNQINNQLNSPVLVDEVSLSVFSHFPLVSISIENIYLKDPLNNKDTLFYSPRFDMSFNALDLIKRKYVIRKLELNEGFCHLHILKNGSKNFSVFKDLNENKNEQFKFVLEQLMFDNFLIDYKNELLSQEYSFLINQSSLSGNFNANSYDLDIESNWLINQFTVDEINYVRNKKSNVKLVLKVVKSPFSLTIDQGELEIADINFEIQGDYTSAKNDEIDLLIKGDHIQLSEVFSVFPIDYLYVLERYSSKGHLNFNAHLKGEISKNKSLLFKADFNTENAAFKDRENDINMSAINLQGDFNNQSKILNVTKFSSKIDDKQLKGSFSLKDFNNPTLIFNIDGTLDLDRASFFFPKNPFDIKGIAVFNLNSELKWDASSTKVTYLKGNVTSDEVFLNYPNTSFNAKAEHLKLDFPNQDLVFTARKVTVEDDELVPFIRLNSWMDLILSSTQKISGEFNLDFKNCHLNQWLAYIPENSDSTSNDLQKNFFGNLSIDNLYYDDLLFKSVRSDDISIKDNLIIKALNMYGHNGNYQLNVSTSPFNSPSKYINIDGKALRIKMDQLFKEFNNFHQSFLTDNQFSVRLSSNFDAKVFYNKKGNIDFQKSKFSTFNNFEKLKLIEYPFLKDILDYFEQSVITRNIIDLGYYQKQINKVQFEDFDSKISMKDGQVYISETAVDNDILDFNIYGQYGLNDSVDYHLNFNWAEIVKKKRNKIDDDQIESQEGKQLFLKISGHIEDLNYSLDKSEVKKERRNKIEEEKESIKKIIKGEDVDEKVPASAEFEVEWNDESEIDQDSISEQQIKSSNSKPKRKKDSSKLNKFLKKIGVEEEQKKKTLFEIDQ